MCKSQATEMETHKIDAKHYYSQALQSEKYMFPYTLYIYTETEKEYLFSFCFTPPGTFKISALH